jgi:hypothetical protein
MEALGLTQLEFMFKGDPVVTSGVGGQAWIIRNGEEGIHVKGPNDVDGAARAVTELVDNPARWKEYSAKARKRAEEFTLTKLIKNLEEAITKEIEKDTGLAEVPIEARSTLAEPEVVLRTWSHSSQRVVATDKRLFIQEGRISRNTFEVPYSTIGSIEHIREYRWGTLLVGVVLSLLLFTQHYMFPIVTRNLTGRVVALLTDLMPWVRSQMPFFVASIWIIPILVASLIFVARLRKGYALHGARLNPIFLPPEFGEAVQFVRQVKDRGLPTEAEGTAQHSVEEYSVEATKPSE